jgi:pimeloyl-ACP methyl ester carboxylesterase
MTHLEFKGDGPLTVFLHGFPGIRSKQNRDIAEQTAQQTGRRCIVPLYSGLGFSKGQFSFESCRSQVQEFVGELIKQNGKMDLVGHSWGGYLSLGLAAKHGSRIGKLVLLSPLLDFFNAKIAMDSFSETAKNNPQLDLGDIEERANEFVDLGTKTTAGSLAAKIDPKTRVSLLQAADDPVTPAEHSQALIAKFPFEISYEIVATDHSFLMDRLSAIERVIAALDQ